MKNVNRITTLLLALVMLAATVGSAAAQTSDVTLKMWTWKQFHMPGLEAVGKDFTAKTGVKISFEVFNPDDAYKAKLQTAAQSGDLPDLLAYWSGSQWDLAGSGKLVDISKDVTADWTKTFLPGTFTSSSVYTQQTFDACKAKADCKYTNLKVGQVFSVPMAAGSFYIVFANKTMLKAAGVDPNIVPKDTNELLDVMDKVHKATGKGVTVGGQFSDILRNWVVNALAVTNCGVDKYVAMLNGDPKASFTDKCAADAFQFIGDMTKRDVWQPGFQALTIDQADVAFAKGQAAFDFGGSFTLGFLLQQGMKAEDIQTFTLPALPSAQQKPIELAPFALIDLGVTTDSKHPAEAKQFIQFLTSPDESANFAKITGELPAVSISNDPKVVGTTMSGLAKSYQNASKSLLAGWSASVAASQDVWTAVDNIANKQVTGEGTLADLLKAADSAARADRTKRGQ